MKISTAVIGTVIIAAGAFAAHWAFRVWKFKQALDAFGQDILRDSETKRAWENIHRHADKVRRREAAMTDQGAYSGPTDEECEEARRARAEAGYDYGID